MSDSHAIPRATARARVRKAKPPKRPWRLSPKPGPWLVGLIAVFLGYMWSVREHRWGGVAACAFAAVMVVDDLQRWWRWRQWSAWSGEPIQWQPQMLMVTDWVANGFFLAVAVGNWLGEWTHP